MRRLQTGLAAGVDIVGTVVDEQGPRRFEPGQPDTQAIYPGAVGLIAAVVFRLIAVRRSPVV